MRGPLPNFRPAEVRDLLRVSRALHEAPPDPAGRKRVLLERLCRLLSADAGVCVVSCAEHVRVGAREAPRTVTVAVVRYGMSEEDARAFAARYRTPPPNGRPPPADPAAPNRRSAGRRRAAPRNGHATGAHYTESVLDVPGMKLQACVALLRRRPRRPFSSRDHAVFDLVHSEMAWVYAPDLPLLSPDGLPLSPRQRQTLQLLLAGNSEKEIASQLGLSHNTVHHYVKAIHRHFGVSSRSELLARWVRK